MLWMQTLSTRIYVRISRWILKSMQEQSSNSDVRCRVRYLYMMSKQSAGLLLTSYHFTALWHPVCQYRTIFTTKAHQVTGLEKRNGFYNAWSSTSGFILFGDVPVNSLTLSNQACRLRLKETYRDFKGNPKFPTFGAATRSWMMKTLHHSCMRDVLTIY